MTPLKKLRIAFRVQKNEAKRRGIPFLLLADGNLAIGTAKAESERLLLMAPVSAQTELAKEIGSNEGYQTYLVSIRQIEANQAVGLEQAKALGAADIKVIANSGQPAEGLKSVMDLVTPKGGLQLGASLEAFANTDIGKQIVSAVKDKVGNGAVKHS